MNWQFLLEDEGIKYFLLPFMGALFGVATGWIGNQLPNWPHKVVWWRFPKLAIEFSILTVAASNWNQAIQLFTDQPEAAQVAGVAYFGFLLMLLGIIALDFRQLWPQQTQPTAADLAKERLIDNRQALMDKVQTKWIDKVLHQSLYQQARLELGLEERADLVGIEWQLAGRARQVLPQGSRLLDRFAKLGKGATLLVTGAPGAGKATLLLELAEELLGCTDAKDPEQPIPVVLNLSSWGRSKLPRDQKPTFANWLVEELYRQYQVRRDIGVTWLKDENWILLLDGLDEVPERYRDNCVKALNQYRLDHGLVAIVLCCRTGDFALSQVRLKHFQAAVFVQPIEVEQVDTYLAKAGPALESVRFAIHEDAELQQLAQTPLFLWVMSLAYENRSANELQSLDSTR